MFDEVVNVASGQAEERVLLTGRHHVADVFCKRYEAVLRVSKISMIFKLQHGARLEIRARIRAGSEIQRRQNNNRAGPHVQRQWLEFISDSRLTCFF